MGLKTEEAADPKLNIFSREVVPPDDAPAAPRSTAPEESTKRVDESMALSIDSQLELVEMVERIARSLTAKIGFGEDELSWIELANARIVAQHLCDHLYSRGSVGLDRADSPALATVSRSSTMFAKEGSRTLILVCRHGFSRLIERVLHREGFGDFQRGRLSLFGGTDMEKRSGASEAFVLMTDVNSAGRLAQVLSGCPIRGSEAGLFELYSVGD